MEVTLSELRAEFGRSRLLSMPIAGAVAALGWPVHAIARTLLVVAVWFAFPAQRFTAIPAVVVVVYLISIAALATRSLPVAPSRASV
jgi:hypothetical protein